MTTTADYIENLSNLVKSGVPLIVTKAREPKKALSAIEDYVYRRNKTVIDIKKMDKSSTASPINFGSWSVLDGWTIKDAQYFTDRMGGIEPDKISPLDKTIDPVAAFNKLLDFKDGVYAMSWIHPFMDVPTIKAFLHEVATKFVSGEGASVNLILVVPEIVNIPPEIQDFVCFLNFDVPSEPERMHLIRDIYEAYEHLGVESPDEDALKMLSAAGAGMTSFELGNSVSRAISQIRKTEDTISPDRVTEIVMKSKTEMLERSKVLEVLEPVNISEVGGLENLIEWATERKDCFSLEAENFGVDRPKGVALGSAPGLGKSLCAKAFGDILKIPVIKFELSNIFGSLVGQSEETARQTLQLIEAQDKCIVLLDEIDKMFNVNSSNGDSGVGQRILGMILTFMQESKARCFWIFTFNRAEGLPPELLRKGRLDEVFSLALPNDRERAQILNIHLKKRKQDPGLIEDLDIAIAAAKGFVSAELEGAVKEAVVKAFTKKIPVTGALIAEQFGNMRALSLAFPEQFEAMDRWARENARPASANTDTLHMCAKPKALAASKSNGRARRIVEDYVLPELDLDPPEN